jgi:hypothetical protein
LRRLSRDDHATITRRARAVTPATTDREKGPRNIRPGRPVLLRIGGTSPPILRSSEKQRPVQARQGLARAYYGETEMNKTKIVAAAMLMGAVTLSTGAFALEEIDVKDRMAFFLNPTGKVVMHTMNDNAFAFAMKNAREVPQGAVFFRSGGKVYLMENKKMGNKTAIDLLTERLSAPY